MTTEAPQIALSLKSLWRPEWCGAFPWLPVCPEFMEEVILPVLDRDSSYVRSGDTIRWVSTKMVAPSPSLSCLA